MASDDDGLSGNELSADVAHISSPVNGKVETRSIFAVKGGVLAPVFVQVRKRNADGTERLLATAYPLPTVGGPWSISVVLGEGTHTIIAVAIGVDGQQFPSKPVTFSVRLALPAPQINKPEQGSTQDVNTWVSGTGGDYSANVKILEDLTHRELGSSPVALTGGWGGSIHFVPGPRSIVARQFVNGRPGALSVVRFFKVRPPRVAGITVTQQDNQGAKFSGTGYNGATLVLSYVSGPANKPLPEIVVAGGVWQISTTAWTPGAYTYSAIQKISDNAGGWIPSHDLRFNFTILPPELEPVPDPVPDRPNEYSYTPTFTGRGTNGATVLIKKQGGDNAVPNALVVNGRWFSESEQEWGPTLHQNVDLKQRLNGRDSANWVRLVVKIPPLAPPITRLVDNDLSPTIEGTCWKTDTLVRLTFSDNPGKVEIATVTGGTWTFRRSTPFAPYVTHTVKVTQIAAQQPSPPTTRTFVVRRTLLNPVITYPTNEIEVERDLTIRGRQGMTGASMQLRIDGINAGTAKLLTSDGDWSIELKGLPFGRRILDAQQTLDDRPSERSDPVVVNVVLTPPVFTVPQPGGDLPRMSMISGEGTPGATVDVWRDDHVDFLLKGVPVNDARFWEGLVTLPVGVTKLRARQAIGLEVSRESPLLTCNVVPAAPYIETPVKDGHVGYSTVVSGFGVPGDTITSFLKDVRLGSALVAKDRTWSILTSLTQPGGAYELVAVASYDGFESDRSARQPVVLGSYLPIIDSPQAGRWVRNSVTFSGQGRAGTGQLHSWFDPDQPWAPNLAVSAQGWQGVSARTLSAGGNWCRFHQTIVDGADASTISDWSESGRFEVEEPPSR
ncbi:hypothetical protein [Pseudomonas frederiksbergensis]|uniref:hypothetical protein n=1 Tax=Pseudomonas frederiksbergensis TaxID=104087 RepID=UPI003D1DF7E9